MASGYGQESPSPGGARSQGKGFKVNTVLRGLDPRTGFPLNCRTPPLLGANEHHTARPTPPLRTPTRGHLSSPPRLRAHPPSPQGSDPPWFALLLVSRASCDGRCGRFPRCWCRFLRCRPSPSLASPGSTDSEGVDRPAEVSPGEDSGIGSRRSPSSGGRATSPWSANRARTRGLSIVFGYAVFTYFGQTFHDHGA